MMKKLLLFLSLLVAGYSADAANDLILTQRKADNSGNTQRNVAPTTSGFLTFDASKLPISPSGLTYVNGNGTTTGQLIHPVGAVGTPSMTFFGRTTNGLYSPAANTVDMAINGAVNARFVTTHLLLGGLTTDGTGVLQFPTGAADNTSGITFGADTNWFREGAGAMVLRAAAAPIYKVAEGTQTTGRIGSVSGVFYIDALNATNTGSIVFRTASGGTTALTLDSSQDALFTPTNRVRIATTKVLSFGATANATIGVSADTTAGVMTFTAPSSGTFYFDKTAEFGDNVFAVNVRAASGGLFYWSGRSRIQSPASGVITVEQDAGGGFDRLQFGGTTSSYPALKRSATTLQVRLADDSADAPITAAGAILSGALITTPQALSGAGAVNVTTSATFLTSTGVLDALTLANGTAEGQIKVVIHKVDGGSAVLTPTTALGFTTITFTNVNDTVTFMWTSAGWSTISLVGAVKA